MIQTEQDEAMSRLSHSWPALEALMSREEFRGLIRGGLLDRIITYRDHGGLKSLKESRVLLDQLIEIEEKLQQG